MRRAPALTLALAACAATTWSASDARAESPPDETWPSWLGPPVQDGASMLLGQSLFIGYLVESGDGEGSGSATGLQAPTLTGITYWERQGFTTGVVTGLLAAAATTARGFFVKDVSYEKQGDSWYRKSTYYSSEERRAIGDRGGALGASIATTDSSTAFEMTFYSRHLPGAGDAVGYKLNFLFGMPLGDQLLFEYGFGFGSVNSRLDDTRENAAPRTRVESNYLGVPLRLSWAAPWFVAYAHWDANLAAFARDSEVEGTGFRQVNNLPFRLGLQANLFGRLFVDASAVTPYPTAGTFGFRLVAGMRF